MDVRGGGMACIDLDEANVNFLLINFLSQVISFIIVAFVLFLIIKGINNLKKKEEPAPNQPAAPTQEELLTQIRDLLKNKQ